MLSRTIKNTLVLLCLGVASFLNAQIAIDYPENIMAECGLDITPAEDNPNVGYPEVTTTCSGGLTDITFSDNVDQLSECGGTGVLLRFWTVNDNCGGFRTLLQRITLVDNTPPEINCVPDVIIDCDASLNPAENPELGFPEIIDCSEGEDLTISYSDQNEGDGFCDGLPEIVRRTWTVTDACGNVNTCEQSIRVGRDPLLIFCEIGDILHECNGLDGSRFAAESWDLSNTNQLRNCTQADCGPVEVISDFDYGRIASGCGITGSFEVNYLIKDNCGNTKFRTVSFALRDTTPPESFCNPIDFGVDCGGDESAASRVESWHTENITLLETCLFDNCGEVAVTSDFIASSFDIGQLNFDCNDEEGFPVNYTLTDECGNQTVKVARLKIVDNAPPTFENVPRDTSIGANDNLAIGQPRVADNCSNGLSPEFSEERIDNTNDDGYQLIRTWTATDDCGNMGTATQTVMVLDPILSLACTSAEVTLEGDKIVISNLLAPNEIVKVFASDNRIVYNCFRNCGEVQTTRSLSPDTYSVEIDFYTANWQLICEDVVTIDVGGGNNDGGGNNGGNEDPCTAAECETTPPVINNLPPDMTVAANEIPNPQNPTATDNCDEDVNIEYNEVQTDDETGNNYVLTRTWTARDDCGNATTGEQVIRVLVDDGGNNGGGNNGGNNDPCNASGCETVPPVIANVPADLTVNFDQVPPAAQPVATDNCDDNVNLDLAERISESIDSRNYTLTRTWTATDDCGNQTTRSQVIKIVGENDGGNGNNGGNNNGTGDCSEIVISTGPLTFNFSNLNAPNKIVKIFDLQYNILLECQENCGTEVSFSYETLGTYLADVQLYTADWEFICETRQEVKLTDQPVDNSGGNNNGGNSDCNNVVVMIDNGKIQVNNLDAPNKIIKLFDENYGIIAECGDDCSQPVAFDLPTMGNYFVDVQLYTADWNFICETQNGISVNETNGGNDGGNSGGNNGGNDNDGGQSDNPCENVQIGLTQSTINLSGFGGNNKIVNIFDGEYNLVYNCFTDCNVEVSAAIGGQGNYLVDIQIYTTEWRLICQTRTEVVVDENTSNGNNNNGGNDNNTSNSAACNEVQISTSNGQIKVSNINQANSIVKLFSENFDLVYECVGTCGNEVNINDLLDGDYQLNIDLFDENWQPICERVEAISLGSSLISNNPSNILSQNNTSSSRNSWKNPNFTLYPNPAKEQIILNLNQFQSQKITIQIVNQLGSVVKQFTIDKLDNPLYNIDLLNVENGLYFIQIKGDDTKRVCKKFLVQGH